MGRIHPPELRTLEWAHSALDGDEITILATASEKEFHRSSDGTLSLYLTVSDISFENNKYSADPDPEERVLIVLPGTSRTNSGGNRRPYGSKGSEGMDPFNTSRVSDQTRTPEDCDRLIRIGDRIRVRGTGRTFEEPRNPGGFNSALYYEIQNISFKITSAEVLAADPGQHTIKDSFYNVIYGIRRQLEKAIEEIYPAETESVIKAMLLGENGQLDGDIKSLYQGAGIIHILSVSGLHISILGMALLRLLKRLRFPPVAAAAASSCVLFGYAVMTGLGPSSLRALFMFSLRITADALHRTYDLLNAAAAAACLLLADEPLYLYHSGFLFSFSAILSIAVILPACKGKIMKAAAVPLGTLPVYLHFYYTFPLYSLVLNLIVIPLMTIVMYSAVLSSAAWFLLPLLGKIASLPALWILSFYKLLCETVQKLPLYTLNPGCPQAGQTAAYYFLVGIWLILSQRSRERNGAETRKIIRQGRGLFPAGPGRRTEPGKRTKKDDRMVNAMVLFFAVMVITLRFHTDELRIDFLDVGQGDGICIEKGDTDILIDGGSSSSQAVGKYVLQPYFQSYGVSDIDYAILTHDDIDHCSGMIELVEGMPENGISIGKLLLPDISEALKGDNYRTLETLAKEKKVSVTYISKGDRIMLGREDGVSIECLYPAQDTQTDNANEASLVLFVRYGNFSALLTGDLEKEGEAQCLEMMKDERLQKDMPSGKLTVLKVGHHGSKNATGEEFLDYLDPDAAVISCGRHNLYGHPAQETLERLEDAGCAICRTDENGMIRVTTDGNDCRIRKYVTEE